MNLATITAPYWCGPDNNSTDRRGRGYSRVGYRGGHRIHCVVERRTNGLFVSTRWWSESRSGRAQSETLDPTCGSSVTFWELL